MLTTVIVLGGTVVIMGIATWIGVKRSQNRVSELPIFLRSPMAIGVLLLAYIAVVVALLLSTIRGG